jgi:hypothetical protein
MSKSFDTLSAMPCFGRYSELREKGLSVKEAYAAANCDAVIRAAHSAEIGLSGTKSHLRSNVPKRASSVTVTMSRTELAEWRSLFPGKSDKDIAELYRRVTKR